MSHDTSKMMAAIAALAMAFMGAFILVQDTDAVYESTTEYGQVYTINLAPGYTYTYTPSYPAGLTVTTTIEKYESAGITATVTNGTLKVKVNDSVTSGDYDIILKASSSTGGVAQTAYQHIRIHVVTGLTVDEAANTINDIIKGATVTFQAQASTNATNSSGVTFPITWAVTSGKTLPAGLTLSGNTVSGTPTNTGLNTVYLTASSGGQTADIVVPFKVWQKIVTQSSEEIFSHGNSVSSTVNPQSVSSTDTSGDLVLTWALKSGTMPSGFSLNASTGVVSGSSTTLSTSNIVIEGTHAASGQSVTKTISIVSEPDLTITPSKTLVAVYSGAPSQTVTFTASSGTSSVTWSIPTTTGLSINAVSGKLTVTDAAAPGTVTVTATTDNGQVKTCSIQIVEESPMAITGAATLSTATDPPVKSTSPCNVSGVKRSVTGVPAGIEISINETTGELTLTDNSPSTCTVKVVATSTTTGQTAEYSVTCTVVAKLVFTDVPSGGAIAYAV